MDLAMLLFNFANASGCAAKEWIPCCKGNFAE
jgi:hypothetical protein